MPFRALRLWLALPLLLGAGTPAARVELEAARRLLPGPLAAPGCEQVDCLLTHAYQADAKARELALELWRASGDVAGVGPEETMDGGFRGMIHLVPELPVHRYRKHLAWVARGAQRSDEFFAQLFPAHVAQPAYRWHGLSFRFVRSVGNHRPSAYALDWTIEYNVEGSLNVSEKGVGETLFHELFHLNDEAHGDWSGTHLRADYRTILSRCGARAKLACLAPFAPNDTLVRGGTFYAFQQNNGDTVHEYAAELAVRYFKEQSKMLEGGRLEQRAFKCGPVENARAWNALVQEFFAGRDLTPPC